MGMFDKEENLTDQDFAKDGAVFTLHSAEYMGMHDTKFGKNAKAKVVAGPDRKEFVCWGVLASQIQRMTDTDLPAEVKIVKDGEANTFEQAA